MSEIEKTFYEFMERTRQARAKPSQPPSSRKKKKGCFYIAFSAKSTYGAQYENLLTTTYTDLEGKIRATFGSSVARIKDLSGNGHDAIQPVESLRPTLRQDSYGLPYLECYNSQGLYADLTRPFRNWPSMSAAFNSGQYWSFPLGIANPNGNEFAYIRADGLYTGVHFRTQSSAVDRGRSEIEGFNNGDMVVTSNAAEEQVFVNGVKAGGLPPAQIPNNVLSRVSIGYVARKDPLSGTITTVNFYGGVITEGANDTQTLSKLQNYFEGISPVATIRKYKIIAAIGQSNMVGRATSDGSSHPPETRQYRYAEGVIPTTSPLNHTGANQGQMGLDVTFTQRLAAAGLKKIIIVPAAQGGTGFSDNRWNPGDSNYNSALVHINTLTRMYNLPIIAFIWHQGERDVAMTGYQTNLDTMIASIRTDVDKASPTTPFILGNIKFAGDEAINAIITDTPNRIPATAVASSSDLTQYDDVHFDTIGIKTLGERYYEALQSIL